MKRWWGIRHGWWLLCWAEMFCRPEPATNEDCMELDAIWHGKLLTRHKGMVPAEASDVETYDFMAAE